MLESVCEGSCPPGYVKGGIFCLQFPETFFFFLNGIGTDPWHTSSEHAATEIQARPLCFSLCSRLILIPTAARFEAYSFDNNTAFSPFCLCRGLPDSSFHFAPSIFKCGQIIWQPR